MAAHLSLSLPGACVHPARAPPSSAAESGPSAGFLADARAARIRIASLAPRSMPAARTESMPLLHCPASVSCSRARVRDRVSDAMLSQMRPQPWISSLPFPRSLRVLCLQVLGPRGDRRYLFLLWQSAGAMRRGAAGDAPPRDLSALPFSRDSSAGRDRKRSSARPVASGPPVCPSPGFRASTWSSPGPSRAGPSRVGPSRAGASRAGPS